MAFDVLVAILYSGDAKDDKDGYYYQTRRDGGELGKELQNGYECKETAGFGQSLE